MIKHLILKTMTAGVISLALGTPALADTPARIDGVTTVTAEQAHQLQQSGATMVDVRVAVEYAEGSIAGAKNVPYKEKSEKSADFDAGADRFKVDELAADKSASLILFCNGPECWKSYKATVLAQDAGYTNLNWLRGGYPEWKAAGLPTE